MSGQGQITAESSGDVERWNPSAVARSVSILEARLANGFLRCHPERWFPGFSERWAPLINVLGCELRVAEIKPTLALPDTSARSFHGLIENESMLISFDQQAAELITHEVVPRVARRGQGAVALEYLVQRCMSVLGMCQTASESAGRVTYCGEVAPGDVNVVASVRLNCSINASPCSILFSIGGGLVDKMDKLWRRQVHSSMRTAQVDGLLRFEVAQLGVPPHLLSDYLTKGTVIDLEVGVTDALSLRVGHKLFMPARMIEVDGKLGCQTVQGAATNLTIPEGTSRLSIELAAVPIDPGGLAELGQVGSVLVTDKELDDQVFLSINQERVAEARLCVYQGRYAVEVV